VSLIGLVSTMLCEWMTCPNFRRDRDVVKGPAAA
jgi:hypothetical protein